MSVREQNAKTEKAMRGRAKERAKTKAGRDPEGAVKEIAAQAQQRSTCPVCGGEKILVGRSRDPADSGKFRSIICGACTGEGTVPAGAGDLAAWHKEMESIFDDLGLPEKGMMRGNLAAMPQAKPVAELLQARREINKMGE